jgi:site-specific recombinase XerD
VKRFLTAREIGRLGEALTRAEREGLPPHRGRGAHSFASVSASAGGSLLVIGKLLGHRESATTQKYAHLLDSPVKAAADVAAGTIADHLLRPSAMRVMR